MANQPLQVIKAVSALPSPLTPNTFYLVRVGQGYDLYATDTTGSNAYKINVSPSQLTQALDIAHGGTGGTDAATARSNLGLGTAAIKDAGNLAGNVALIDSKGYINNPCERIFTQDYRYRLRPDNTQYGLKFYFTSRGAMIDGENAANYCDAFTMSSWPDSTGGNVNLIVGGKRYRKLSHGWGNIQTTYWEFKDIAYVDDNTQNMVIGSVKSGQASYAKGWRKLTATLPSQAGEITLAHGVTTVETVQAKVTNTDGIIIYNNDIDPANQFYVRVNGANLVLGVTANSTKVFGQSVTIYVGEEL